MNETVIRRPAFAPNAPANTDVKRLSGWASALYGYGSLTAMIVLGWLLRDQALINPEDGVGYWLGIIGGSLMLVLLLYPLRKRIRLLHMLGPTRVWFRMHMILGLVGPLLILYHCNFQIGSFNSRVALYCMLLVAGSGIIGRHLYARIHRGLYGRKTSLKELQRELAQSAEKSHGMANIMPNLVKRLDRISNELQGDAITHSLGVGRSLNWTFTHHFTRLSLLFTARRELKAAAAKSPALARNYKRLRKTTSRYIGDYTMLIGRVAQYSFYERLFALWHIFHLPIFFMMVLSALIHVLAVHMY
ncbi:MAG: hypothetical protein OEW35_06315 [Gammaproteobacteria bacterium]|nr:hypothetical protein [Gammaproteobacteria bacterium]MDH4253388.1 hypothetical protein [Gammaproteobacteria bacterium]MDH5310301.1 hypothetical protein [Gammaproteobacteria bacterium]MDH5501223.1 hypothetical protein [Gammaproteobacteria bacterium]